MAHRPPDRLLGRRLMVTGGAGFIGSHLVDAISGLEPECLVVADNFFLGRESNLAAASAAYPSLIVAKVDVADAAEIGDLVAEYRPEVVFDLATVPLPYSLEHPAATIDQNVRMATNLAELARRDAFGTLIHFSTSEVYGTARQIPMDEDHPIQPLTPYAASKAAADHIVRSYQATFAIDATIVRPFNNYGPRQNEGSYAALIPKVIRQVLGGEPVEIYGDGTQTRDFIHVRDTVRGTLALWAEEGTRGSVVNLASGHETQVKDIVNTIVDVLGQAADVRYADTRPGDVMRHCGSSQRARDLFGFSPEVNLRQGLAETVAWYGGQIALDGEPDD